MDRIYKQFRIAKLLINEMFRKLDSEYESELNEWKNKHQQTYDYVNDWTNFEARKAKLSKIDVSKEWQVFQEKNYQKKSKDYKFQLFKYAAIIILLISFTSVAYWIFTTSIKEINTEVASIEIPHGEKKAELILSNGQSIQLHPSSKNILKEADGTVIANDSIMLSYEGLEKSNTQKSTEVLYNTLNIARGGEYFLVLNDGTKVWVNSLSSLKYPVVFTGKERVVELLSGEAYFEVVNDPSRPFIVKNNSYNINVMGTSFNISCYNEEDAVATLVEGHVKISNVAGNESQNFNILANDQFTFNKSEQSVKIQKVDAKSFSSWIEGNFSFENETLEKIFQKLERWYNIDVNFATDKAKLYEFTGMLPRFENFEVILEMLEIIGEVEFTVDGNKVFINIK